MKPDPKQPDAGQTPSAIEQGYDFSQQVGHLLRKVYQRHSAIFQQHSGDTGLTSIQFVVLCAVVDAGPSSLSEIVQATAVDYATLRGVIKRLKTHHAIELSSDASDHRKVIVNATWHGHELVSKMIPNAMRITDLTLENLNPAERIALVYLLEKVI